MIKLGSNVTDSITGFTGIATERHETLHRGARVLVESRGLQDGKPVEPQWIDEPRLQLLTVKDQ